MNRIKLGLLALAIVFSAISIFGAVALLGVIEHPSEANFDAMLIVPVGMKGEPATFPSREDLNALAARLMRQFNLRIDIGEKVEMPQALRSRGNNLLRADLALADLARRTRNKPYLRVVGVTIADVTLPKQNFAYGLAYKNGHACIASAARLGEGGNSKAGERLAKSVLHLLGHTFALMHSTSSASVMYDFKDMKALDKAAGYYSPEKSKRIIERYPYLANILLTAVIADEAKAENLGAPTNSKQ